MSQNNDVPTPNRIHSSKPKWTITIQSKCLPGKRVLFWILTVFGPLSVVGLVYLTGYNYAVEMLLDRVNSSASPHLQSTSFIIISAETFRSTPVLNAFHYHTSEMVSLQTTAKLTTFTSANATVKLTPMLTFLSKTVRKTPNRRTTSAKVTERPNDVSRYVSFAGGFADGRGLGNQIFCFAATLYVAELTRRKLAIEKTDYIIKLNEVFDLNIERFDSLCPCIVIDEAKHLAFDEATDRKVLHDGATANKSILVGGFRQSWRYTLAIEHRLRRHLIFKNDIRKFAENFLDNHIPSGWNRAGFIRVAIHVRRGDILSQRLSDYGYTVPNVSYFKKAMTYFTERYSHVQFITFSDDPKWPRDHIKADNQSSKYVHVTHSFSHSDGQDLAIMSICDHVIMSSGTYGWWGAWLAKGTTIYYKDWPRNGSDLEKQFIRKDFFPPNWIPMTD